jgi:hypothetical protein
MHKLEHRVKKLEQNIAPNENKPKQYFVGCERMTVEEWNDYIKNPDKWITVLPDEEPEGFIIKLKNVRLP